jgi:hypothetical protein
MNQGPSCPRTDAWNPRGVLLIRIVAVGSVMPCPAYVVISGCRTARPGSITGDSSIAKS